MYFFVVSVAHTVLSHTSLETGFKIPKNISSLTTVY